MVEGGATVWGPGVLDNMVVWEVEFPWVMSREIFDGLSTVQTGGMSGVGFERAARAHGRKGLIFSTSS